MRHGELLSSRFKVVDGVSAPNTALTNSQRPASGSYVDVQGVMAVHIFIKLGTIADALTFKVQQADAADGTLSDVSGLTKTILATDDGQYIYMMLDPRKLEDEDHHWITTTISGVSGNNYAAIMYLLEGASDGHMPVTQTSTVLPSDNVVAVTGYS